MNKFIEMGNKEMFEEMWSKSQVFSKDKKTTREDKDIFEYIYAKYIYTFRREEFEEHIS